MAGKALRGAAIVGGTLVALYALTVIGVWVTACVVDLRVGEDLEDDDEPWEVAR